MPNKTSIEWTDMSANPIRARNKKTGKTGFHCEHASDGCIAAVRVHRDNYPVISSQLSAVNCANRKSLARAV